MGWTPARESSNEAWFAPYLATLLEDPYAAVRYIAGRSLKRLSGYDGFSYDYIAVPDELRRSRNLAFDLWTKLAKPVPNASLLVEKDGRLSQVAVESLQKSRNNRALDLQE